MEDQVASPSLELRNPFVPGSQIRFEIPSEQPASLVLYVYFYNRTPKQDLTRKMLFLR